MSEHLLGHLFLFRIKNLTLESHSNVKTFVIGIFESYKSDEDLYKSKIVHFSQVLVHVSRQGYEEIEIALVCRAGFLIALSSQILPT